MSSNVQPHTNSQTKSIPLPQPNTMTTQNAPVAQSKPKNHSSQSVSSHTAQKVSAAVVSHKKPDPPEPSYVIPMSPLALSDSNLLKWATSWTKRRLFTEPVTKKGAANTDCDLFPLDDGVDQQHTVSYRTPTAGPDISGQVLISLGQGSEGYVLIAYPNEGKIQVWRHLDNQLVYCGSTEKIDGKILRVDFIHHKDIMVVAQVSRRRETVLKLFVVGDPAYIDEVCTIELFPTSSGPGPYYLYSSCYSEYFAIATSDGLVTIFAVDETTLVEIQGIRCNLGSDGRPLFDIHGRWIVFSPKTLNGESTLQKDANAFDVSKSAQGILTPVQMPPKSSLQERFMDSLSNTAAASLKSLSDRGKASLRQYLQNDRIRNSQKTDNANGTKTNSRYGYFPDDYYYYDEDDDNSRKRTKNGTDSTGLSSDLKNMIFGDPNVAKNIHVFDIVAERTMGYFSTLNGTSAISLSPYDCTLACVSANGDYIDTYDLSFLPKRVVLSGRLIRGRSYANCQRISWDRAGGVGLSTWNKGSVHWFDKSRSLDKTNKVWKCSGWNIEDMSCRVASDESDEILLFARQGQILAIDPHTGHCEGKFDIPLNPFVPENNEGNVKKIVQEKNSTELETDSLGESIPMDPMAEFELETCLPYPFIHTDRNITMRILDDDALVPCFDILQKDGFILELFGVPIKSEAVVFNNVTKAGPEDDTWENIEEEPDENFENNFEDIKNGDIRDAEKVGEENHMDKVEQKEVEKSSEMPKETEHTEELSKQRDTESQTDVNGTADQNTQEVSQPVAE